MKKFFTFIATVVCLFAFSASSQAAKKWDFTKWSGSTVSQVCGAEDWTKDESASKKYITGDEIRWVLTPTFDADGNLMAGGSIIEEFEGLRHTGVDPYELAMAFNYGTTTDGNNWGPFASPSYLWVCGNSTSIVVPEVKAGSVMKLGVESHNPGNARGFKLTVNGEEIAAQTTKEYAEFEYIIPEAATEYVEVSIIATKGCHLYFIEAEVKDLASDPVKVAYLYDGTDGATVESLALYQAVGTIEGVTFEPVNVAAAVPGKDVLMAYDAVVIDGNVAAGEALVASLKENIQWQPVVNFNPELAVALGYGEAVEGGAEFGFATDVNSKYLKGFETYLDEEQYPFSLSNGDVMAVPLKLTGHEGEVAFIANGSVGDTVYVDEAIAYARNANHNAYIYYGLAGDYNADTQIILQNIIAEAASSKTEITATSAPAITAGYSHMQTTVSMSCTNKNSVIYYTVDGTVPTTASAVYAEPIVFTTECTVLAVALAEGYTISEVDTFEVKLYPQAKAPVVTIEGDETKGDVLVTLTQVEGADIWYNFTGSAEKSASTLYDGPITLKSKVEISVFALSDSLGLVQSELTTETVKANMLNVRRDELAHFTADGWNTLENLILDGEQMTAWAKSNYYFTWGNKAVATTVVTDSVPLKDDQDNYLEDENGNWIYPTEERTASVTINTADPAWQITSQGQCMVWQNLSPGTAVGDAGGYNPDRAEDLIGQWGTKNDIQFAGVASGDKCSATIQSTGKYAGPFNVITVVANAGSGVKKIAVQVSKDSIAWETIGDTLGTAATKRLYKTHEVSYDGTDEVYVRLAAISGTSQCIQDIYVLNSGEKSKAEEQEYITGIEEVKTSETAVPVKVKKVVINGRLVIVTPNGSFNVAGVQVK